MVETLVEKGLEMSKKKGVKYVVTCCPKHSIYKVKDGILILSSQTYEDLPLPANDNVPSGPQYLKDAKKHGDVYARFLWRQRNGRSYLGPGIGWGISKGLLK